MNSIALYDLIDQHTGVKIPKGTEVVTLESDNGLFVVATLDRTKKVGRVKQGNLIPIRNAK